MEMLYTYSKVLLAFHTELSKIENELSGICKTLSAERNMALQPFRRQVL